MTINEIMKRAFLTNEAHGFHDNGAMLESAAPTKLMLIVSEIAEAMEDIRTRSNWHEEICRHPDSNVPGDCAARRELGLPIKPDGVPAELADAVIRICDFAQIYEIDLDRAIEEKMAYNETREYRHGGKRV